MRAAVLARLSSLVSLILLVALLAPAAGCGDDLQANITIVTRGSAVAWRPVIDDMARLTRYRGLRVITEDATLGDGFPIEVVDVEGVPAQGYRLSAAAGGGLRVEAHDLLGVQYGVAAALEALGFRFRHPSETYLPELPVLGSFDGAMQQPDIRVRGMQLHTLHPIEGYFAFWEPSAAHTDEAHRIIDWLVKNRGNFLQWVPLDNILDPEQHAPWKAFTQELISYAHFRGVRVGINIQLFGAANLQQAYDLVDEEDVPVAPQIAARLPPITEDLPFDVYTLSFGEFFNADPDAFIASVNEVRAQLRIAAPQAEMHTVIHVGDEQKLTYRDEELIYYFLVKFADESIHHDVHTVMFYNLFEDAGGAYHHDDFSEHREHLQARMCAEQPHAYMPETAYWVAFDNSVPQFFPLYVHSRLYDLEKLQEPEGACGTLDNHYLFSTGWDWMYWLNDVTGLRASYKLVTPAQAIEDALTPDLGTEAAALVTRMMEAQREYVLNARLTGYLVGRDAVIDLGKQTGIVSQPDRIEFDDLVEGTGRPEVETMLVDLRAYADAIAALDAEVRALPLPDSRWARELRDGFAIDVLRARFVTATYEATLAHLDGDAAGAAARLADAEALLAEARRVIARRHGDLHDAHGRSLPTDNRLTGKTPNFTLYQFGYLYFADSACYWERELVQVGRILGTVSTIPPSCFF